MYRMNLLVLCLAGVWALSGCAGDDAYRRSLADAVRLLEYERPADIRAERPDIGALDEPFGKGWPVEQFVAYARKHNPGILAARRRVAAASEVPEQVESLPDPLFGVAVFGEGIETAAGAQQGVTKLSQKFPYPERLTKRGDVARAVAKMVFERLRETELRVIAAVKQTYYELYFASRAVEVTKANRTLLESFLKVAEAKYRVGKASQQDVLRAQTELSNLINELITLGQRLDSAKARMNSLLSRPTLAAVAVPGEFPPRGFHDRARLLFAIARSRNPRLARLVAAIEKAEARERLAQLKYVPDVTVSATYFSISSSGLSMAANGDDAWNVGAVVNLPIWRGPLSAGVRQARLEAEAARSALGAEEDNILYRVQDLWLRVDAARRLESLLRTTIIPQAEQTLKVSMTGYQAGELDFLTLVDNWRRLLKFRLDHYRAKSDFEQAIARLEEAVGSNLAQPGAPEKPEVKGKNGEQKDGD
ncbi:MAG: TolC family protein [Planctomycetia bacterium]|nr:TolC family protein [Planctomycetia bacterium]